MGREGDKTRNIFVFPTLRLRIKPGGDKKVRGKACFAEGGGNFLALIFNIAMIDAILML